MAATVTPLTTTPDKYLEPVTMRIVSEMKNGVTTTGTSDVLNSIYLILIAVCIVGAFFMLVRAATKRMLATSASSLSESNKDIKRAVLGLLGIFLIYPILNELNPTLLKSKLGDINLNSYAISTENDDEGGYSTVSGAGSAVQTSRNPVAKPTNVDMQNIVATEAQIRSKLQAGGISINRAACSNVGQGSCTNVGAMSATTQDNILAIKNACNCQLIVTGGTEWWLHGATTRHRPDGSAFDLSSNSELDNFFAKQKKQSNAWRICVRGFYTWNGLTVCGESNHWHLQ